MPVEESPHPHPPPPSPDGDDPPTAPATGRPSNSVPPGTIVVLAEDEYRYGIGPLRLRVHRVTPTRSEPGWALVDGIRIDHRGRAHERREVLARLDALHRYIPPDQPGSSSPQ